MFWQGNTYSCRNNKRCHSEKCQSAAAWTGFELISTIECKEMVCWNRRNWYCCKRKGILTYSGSHKFHLLPLIARMFVITIVRWRTQNVTCGICICAFLHIDVFSFPSRTAAINCIYGGQDIPDNGKKRVRLSHVKKRASVRDDRVVGFFKGIIILSNASEEEWTIFSSSNESKREMSKKVQFARALVSILLDVSQIVSHESNISLFF